MGISEMRPQSGESEAQYLWRIGNAKDSGVLEADWEEIGDAMNRYFREDEAQYRCSSAYRKPYQYAKTFLGSVLVEKNQDDGGKNSCNDKAEIRKEIQKLRDERTAYRKLIRDESRLEGRLDEIERVIKLKGEEQYDWVRTEPVALDGKSDLLILLGDWHIGLENVSSFGVYNKEIAKKRLDYLAGRVQDIALKHSARNCYVAVLGDMISGSIHKSVMVSNSENVIEQTMDAAQMLCDFCAKLCALFEKVRFVNIAGNHSRIDPSKENALKDERLDDILGWYVKSMMSCYDHFCPEYNFDNTVAKMRIRGKLYYFVHGDHDPFMQSSISKLVLMMGEVPYCICAGHLHKFEMGEVSSIKLVRNGCLCGCGDDYTIEKRICGEASQTVLVCDEKGIQCAYPVEFD